MDRREIAARMMGGVAAGLASSAAEGELVDVKTQRFRIRDYRLESGVVMPEVVIAYQTYGRLAADGRNAVLLTHGYTGSHHMAGRMLGGGDLGSWDDLVGPGKAIDTNRLFVVSSNMLGSSYGSTSPAFINPATGKPYGPDFPDISLVDIITAQKRLLESLGVKHLVAVAGASYGGTQTFQWGVTFPDFMDGIVPVASAPRSVDGAGAVPGLVGLLAGDPNWNGGWYYDKGGIAATLTKLRIATLKRYGIDDQLKGQFPEVAAREAEIERRAETWASVFDGNSLVVLGKASVRFDVVNDLPRLKAKVLYVLSRTDKVFAPTMAPGVMAQLKAAGVDADYFEIDSEMGHLASDLDAAKWAPRLRAFMASLEKRS